MSKPLVIKLRQAKSNITESVNAALREGIPCYLLEPIIAEIHSQVSKAAQTEYENAAREYEATQKQAVEETIEAGGEDDGKRAEN